MNRFASAVVATTLALGLSACAPSPSPTPTSTLTHPTTSIEGDWQLSSGSDAHGKFDVTVAPVRMTLATGTVTGKICNSWSGKFVVHGSTVAAGPLMSTEMYCSSPDGIMDLESRFLEDLPLVTSVELTDRHLHLSGAGVELVFDAVG